MAVVRKKQDDKNLKVLREFVTINGNRNCFDCGQRGPTYINMTIGSFICTQCSGVLRGLTPPHRVKSISMATFSQDEIEFIKRHGNDECAKTWLGLCDISDPKRPKPQDQREHMIDKYERKRYYLEPASPLKSIAAAATTASTNSSSSNSFNSAFSGGVTTSASNSPQSNNRNGDLATVDSSLAALKAITLTPPASARTNGSRSHHHRGGAALQNNATIVNGVNSNNNLNSFHQPFSSSSLDNSLFNNTNNQQQQQNRSSNQNLVNNMLNNNNINSANNNVNNNNTNFTMSPLLATNGGTNKHHLHLNGFAKNNGTTSDNKFTPDSDFVADFNSADIFNANVTNNNNTLNNKISANFNNYQKSNGAPMLNGNGLIMNGTTGTATSNGMTENFADFEHNPIFNAAEYQLSMVNKNNSNDSSSSQNNNSNTNKSSINGFSNFTDYQNHDDDNNNTSNSKCGNDWRSSSNLAPHWNFWQELQWPAQMLTANQQQHQLHHHQIQPINSGSIFGDPTSFSGPPMPTEPHLNRWSLPMSISSSNSVASSLGPGTTFPSNSSINSTPSADRYAALKDLDEQLKEEKFNQQQIHEQQQQQQHQLAAAAAVSANPNPFKAMNGSNGTCSNPFKMPQTWPEAPIPTNGTGGMTWNMNAVTTAPSNGGFMTNFAVTAPQKSNNPFL